jgi:putative transposase
VYEYRNLTPEERAQVIEDRKRHGFPSHAPPHPVRDRTQYLITAACYEHNGIMTRAQRRQQLLDLIFEVFISTGVDILAWVVLPNHYHLLLDLPNFDQLGRLVRSCHGPTARWWNLEDDQTGRKVWFRYTDRAIRSERHYYTTLNYLHYNSVKHGRSQSPYDWAESSVHWYLACQGREWLRELWQRYPVRDYGRSWDEYEKR